MKNMQRLWVALTLAVFTTVGAVQAQTRTWGFAKDTVYEWASGGDSVALVNSGVDTLSFDSVAVEIALPSGGYQEVMFEFYKPVNTVNPKGYSFIYNGGAVYWPPPTGPRTLKVAGGEAAALKNFKGKITVVPVNKRAAISGKDTVMTRLIFLASSNRGQDTLIFYSMQDLPSALRAIGLKSKPSGASGTLYDLRGRRQETAPNAVRIPFRAIVTDRKKN